MVSAIFGPRSSNLNQNVLIKLKAVYTLVEQLYTGSQHALAVVALSNEVPTHLADVLRRLAVLPQRFQELRRASARAGAIAALSRAKAFLPELDPADIALGYPSLKEDGTPFDHNKLALNYIFEITITAYLRAFKYTSGLYNPNNEVENSGSPALIMLIMCHQHY
ncbi:uncharacterized protein [Triticum aestivum]|uniref:uncharacterized protein n=1 Tax=Triticum aestivum TaxID=4565 RepID=UPI001D023A86|nr:uncharacterized protein LOC123165847 [Triticum aestivum]